MFLQNYKILGLKLRMLFTTAFVATTRGVGSSDPVIGLIILCKQDTVMNVETVNVKFYSSFEHRGNKWCRVNVS